MVGILSMKAVCGLTINCMSFLWSFVFPKVDGFFVHRYLCPVCILSLNDALRQHQSCFDAVISSTIGSVLPRHGLSQILYSIIQAISIDVINLVLRPAPMVHEPDKAMGLVDSTRYCHAAVAFLVDVTGSLPNYNVAAPVLWRHPPRQRAGYRTILQPEFS